MVITFEWRGAFESREVEALHAEAFHHDVVEDFDWQKQARDHSLGWVCARDGGDLVGFVNVAWDGETHFFLLDRPSPRPTAGEGSALASSRRQ